MEVKGNTDRLRNQMSSLQQLNTLLLEMTAIHSEAELLKTGVRGLVNLMGISHAAIMLMTNDGTYGEVVSEYPEHGTVGHRIPLHNNPIATLLLENSNRYVLLQDIPGNPMIVPGTREILQAMGVKATLVLPLLVYNRLIGTVGLDIYEDNRFFDDDMIAVAQTFATQIAVGIQNIRLIGDAERRVEQLQGVNSLSRALQASLQLDVLLNTMLIETQKLLPADRVTIALYGTGSDQLKTVAQFDGDKNIVDISHGPIVPLESTLLGEVWQSGKTLTVNDTTQGSMLRRLQDASVRSLMVAPVSSRERRLGVMMVSSLRPNTYTETDTAVFQQVLAQLGVTIENSTALTESQRAAETQALLNSITAHLQQHNDLETMFAIALQELGLALGARRVRVVLTTDDQ